MTPYASPKPESGGQWTFATALSISLHGAALVWLLDLLPSFQPAPTPPIFPETVITITPSVAQIDTDGQAAPGVAPDTAQVADPAESLPPVEAAPPAELAVAEPAPPADIASADPVPMPEAAEPSAVETAPVAAPETAQTVAPVALAPISPQVGGASAAPVPTLGAVAPEEAVAEAVPPSSNVAQAPSITTLSSVLTQTPPAAPPPPAQAPAQDQDPALTALIDRIRSRLDDPCLVALPRPQAAPLGPLVTTLTDQDVTARRFADAVLTDPDLPVDTATVLVDARQCPALVFLRAQAAYPAFQLRMGLAQTQVPSGGTLVGRIEGSAGAYTSLLLVDDNGVVQDLRRFLRFTGGRAEFAIPVTRDGAPRETAHLLIALATAGRPQTITDLAGRRAADVFPPLSAELGPGTRLAVQAVDIR
ncbi:MAG: hypothetical protein AAFY65_17930 [Pseudomonadota bacterium]